MLIEGPQAVNMKYLEGTKARLRDWSAWANNVCDLPLPTWIATLNCEGGQMQEEATREFLPLEPLLETDFGAVGSLFETAPKRSLWRALLQ